MNITLSQLKQVIKESIEKYLLTEMSKINTKEFYGLFPSNKFDVRVWSNDHNPPHLHVISKDGWNVKVKIENGDIISHETHGYNSQTLKYIEQNIQKWLNSKNAKKKNKTNREVAFDEWNKEPHDQ